MKGIGRGARIGPYEVFDLLGAGGMGEVWRAHDLRLGRDVALKVLADPAPAASETDWFSREGRLLAQLNHPNIAQLYGLEESGETRALVLEYVPGESLDRRLRQGPLPFAEAVSLLSQAASALEYAHERGVVHRDLKPANLMRMPDGTVKVLDFGLAKSFVPLSSSDSDPDRQRALVSAVSGDGLLVGTLSYMSPEQARGKPAGPETDVWGLGAVLFELVSGQRPFRGETPSDTLAAILGAPPDWSLLPAGLPVEARRFLEACLEKDRTLRMQTARDAARALRAMAGSQAASEPTTALEATKVALIGPALSLPGGTRLRDRALRVAASVAAAALLVLVTLWVVRGRSPETKGLPEARSLLVLPFRDLTGDPAIERLGQGIAQTLAVRLSREPGILVLTWDDPASLPTFEANLAGASRQAGANLVVRGTVLREDREVRVTWTLAKAPAGTLLAGDTLSGGPTELLALQDRVAEKIAAALRPADGAPTDRARRPAEDPALSDPEAQDRYLQALGALQRYDRPGTIDEAAALLSGIPSAERSPLVQAALARAYVLKYRATKDPTFAVRASEAAAAAVRTGSDSAAVLAAAGQVQLQSGKSEAAAESFRRALRLQPSLPEALVGLAEALERSGNSSEASRMFEEAVNRLEVSWWALGHAGAYHYRQGRYAEAVRLFQRAAVIVPDNSRILSNLAGALFQIDDLPGTRAALDRAIAIAPNPVSYSNLGTVLYAQGDYSAAASAFASARSLGGSDSLLLVNWGDACRQAPGRTEKAPSLYHEAIAAAKKELAVDPEGAEAHLSLALAYAKLGESGPAASEQQKVLSLAGSDPDVLFQCAIVSVHGGRPEEALALLDRSIAAGHSRAALTREPELAPLQSHSKFMALAAPARSNTPMAPTGKEKAP